MSCAGEFLRYIWVGVKKQEDSREHIGQRAQHAQFHFLLSVVGQGESRVSLS